MNLAPSFHVSFTVFLIREEWGISRPFWGCFKTAALVVTFQFLWAQQKMA